MGCVPSKADPDVWMRAGTKVNGMKIYKYILVYVNDFLVISCDCKSIMMAVMSVPYKLKDVGPPTRYLGATTGKEETDGPAKFCWTLSSKEYLINAIATVKENMRLKSAKKCKTPISTGYHPELDFSQSSTNEQTNYYQSLIGILRWAVELGRIDVSVAVSMLSSYSATPQIGHLEQVAYIIAYLKSHLEIKLIFDPDQIEWDDGDFLDVNWEKFYPKAKEQLPPNMPEPRGISVQINMFTDASHEDDLVIHRSCSSIIIFIEKAPIIWYTNKQNTI